MKLSIIQCDISWNSPATNVAHANELAGRALAQGGELLVFPEMFTCGFSMPVGTAADEAGDAGRALLSSLATSRCAHTLGTVPERGPDGSLYNTACLYGPDGACHSYRKVHLFSYGDETATYSAGSSWLNTEVGGVRTSVFICYDLRFPIPFYSLAPATDLFIIPANWPAPRREHWLTLLRARAIESQCYVAGINRVGQGGGLLYSGDSAVFAPDGSCLAQAGSCEEILTVSIDPHRVAEWRESFPALRDRRPDTYPKW